MHKIFISYHHANDQMYKEILIREGDYKHFIDGSVNTGDIDENLSSEKIREKIRDEYLRDTSVTVVLVGKCTKHRKHIDWEIGSSMINGKLNKSSGIVVIELPSISTGISSNFGTRRMKEELEKIRQVKWISKTNKDSLDHPDLPEKIKENIDRDNVKIPVLQWNDVSRNMSLLEEAIEYAYQNRSKNDYYISEFRKHDNNSCW